MQTRTDKPHWIHKAAAERSVGESDLADQTQAIRRRLHIASAGHCSDDLAQTEEGWRFRRCEVTVDLPLNA